MNCRMNVILRIDDGHSQAVGIYAIIAVKLMLMPDMPDSVRLYIACEIAQAHHSTFHRTNFVEKQDPLRTELGFEYLKDLSYEKHRCNRNVWTGETVSNCRLLN